MNMILRFLISALVCGTWSIPVFALRSGLTDAKGECIFSKDFTRDYESAQKMVDELQLAEPLLKLLKKYRKTEEQAELELSIGLVYNQRTGVVDPDKAVLYLSNALKYNLPEKNYLQILMWRGNSLEELKKYDESLKDYLRGLLACSYHDLSGGWPEIKSSNVPIFKNSDDPENAQRVRDYQTYRRRIDFQRFLLMQRYFLIDATRRIQSAAPIDDDRVLKIIKELSPDTSRYVLIIQLLKSENKRPWP